jgi:hypothetical protein
VLNWLHQVPAGGGKIRTGPGGVQAARESGQPWSGVLNGRKSAWSLRSPRRAMRPESCQRHDSASSGIGHLSRTAGAAQIVARGAWIVSAPRVLNDDSGPRHRRRGRSFLPESTEALS